jgi:ERCC4-type nuclease
MGIDVALTTLEFADIAFEGQGDNDASVFVGIELKKLPDLISSLRTGRLSGHQLPGLAASYDYRWLLVEGTWRPDAKGRITTPRRYSQWAALPGMAVAEMEKRVLTLELMGGLRVRHTSSRACTLHFIASLYRWFTDGAMDRHTSHLAPHTAHSFLPLSDFRQTVMRFPHIGLAASKSVEDYFGANLREACLASVADWAEIVVYDKKGFKRLGMTVALAITQFIRGQKP